MKFLRLGYVLTFTSCCHYRSKKRQRGLGVLMLYLLKHRLKCLDNNFNTKRS